MCAMGARYNVEIYSGQTKDMITYDVGCKATQLGSTKFPSTLGTTYGKRSDSLIDDIRQGRGTSHLAACTQYDYESWTAGRYTTKCTARYDYLWYLSDGYPQSQIAMVLSGHPSKITMVIMAYSVGAGLGFNDEPKSTESFSTTCGSEQFGTFSRGFQQARSITRRVRQQEMVIPNTTNIRSSHGRTSLRTLHTCDSHLTLNYISEVKPNPALSLVLCMFKRD
ncbi:hypothetical protein BO78DRAFT_384415 [Aspergillus sclerotiicarbonarius CBS 121057]|uniref:Uncharacterized protein n=1 Tax=Aspergillus sclerotiicarbonarius (strain CBS 121057 / IBT 28362) TaxID=1448318 RepID=A0A319EX75_ASPSB|nr:hypothetical protein BO78DRAFT_384415 [Aspergillus sclerotiicarbonarius CBS 121057]